MPAARRATWGASRIELTRASTAIDAGSTSGSASQPPTTATTASAPPSGVVLDDAQRPGRAFVVGSGDDLLGDAPIVVAEQRRRGGDDLGRAAIVDTQGVLAGAREQGAVVDEESRVGAGVPVDALVVVADAEHVERRQAEQADQQDVGRREVLELVDEQVPAAALHLGAERTVGEDRLDGGVDLLVEVDDATVAQGAAESREQLAESVDVVAGAPRRRRGRAARGGRRPDLRGTGRSDRRWPVLRRCPGSNESTSLRTSRSSMTGGCRPRCSRSTHRPSELSVRTCGPNAAVRAVSSRSASLL